MNPVKNLMIFALMAMPFFLSAQTTENRKLDAFNKIKVSGSFATSIRQGNAPGVIIEAEGVAPSAIITEINNNTLSVYLEKGQYRNINVKVSITYTALRAISQSGSGKLVCESSIESDAFDLGSSGSGGMILKEKIQSGKLYMGISGSGSVHVNEVEAQDVKLNISGSGGLYIEKGKAKHLTADIAGSGGMKAFGLTTEDATISIAGSGGAELTAENSLNGTIAGSGNISYKGSPFHIRTHSAGSGRMRKI